MKMISDTPNVFVRPPILYAATFGGVALLQLAWPLPMVNSNIRFLIAGLLAAVAIAIIVQGRRALAKAGTNVNPALPTTALVTSGPYGISRNPLYVGLTLIFLAMTLCENSWWGVIVLPALVVALHHGIVLREERYLEGKFGDAYRQYRLKVRRYV